MSAKRLIPWLGCKEGRAVVPGVEGAFASVISDNLLESARHYSDNGADELFIHDLSETEEDHERFLLLLKEVSRQVDIPVITGGRVQRLEDLKKYLYAGAKAVFLDVSDENQVDLIKEGAHRFGNERIYGYVPEASYLRRAEEWEQLGASALVLACPCKEEEHALLTESPLPLLAFCEEDTPERAAAWLRFPSVEGVLITVREGCECGCTNIKYELKKRGIPMDTLESSVAWEDFRCNGDGLIPVVVQDYRTSQVLMLAYMNREAFDHTLRTGKMTYYSRSRAKLWLKGETSGHFQYVKSLHLDCDNDTLLAKVKQVGAACHTGARSCFFQTLAEKEYRDTNPLKVFEEVFAVILDRKENPKEGSYTNYLFDKGLDKILKKLGEEAAEIIIAAKNPNPEEIKYEISDFLYHMMVLMAERGITWEEIMEELAHR